jgi:hypothetical protein
MALEHLEGKRTGRPPGTKSRHPLLRDFWWAVKNQGKDDAHPPDEWAELLLAQGRADPAHMAVCVAKIKALERQVEPCLCQAAGPAGGNAGPTPVATDAGPGLTPTVPADGPAMRVRLVFVPDDLLRRVLTGDRPLGYLASLPPGIRLISGTYDPERQGLLLTVSAGSFEPVAPGQAIPELEPARWASR